VIDLSVDRLLTSTLYVLGAGFLVANLGWRTSTDLPAAAAKRLLIWSPPKPPQYTFMLTLGVALACWSSSSCSSSTGRRSVKR
jgi:hypothetical protein